MGDKKRVLIQMKHTPELRKALTAASLSADSVPALDIPGFSLDESYTPAKIPARVQREKIEAKDVGKLFTFDARDEASTYLVRGEVESQAALDRLMEAAGQDPNVSGVFSDSSVAAIQVCPQDPVGNHKDVAKLLETEKLQTEGMDGSNVIVAIVDTGIDLDYLKSQGVDANIDVNNSWSPLDEVVYGPGRYPKDHGTMCAFDVSIAAPNCTILDFALLRSQAPGRTQMEGFLSDAIKGFSKLLDLADGQQAVVVNCSFGMFHPSWDFPVGNPGNYSDNPNHPFNIIVESLSEKDIDVLFAAGNCGKKCPDGRCLGVTDRPIYGANSHEDALCIGGVTIENNLLGYSSQGPGRLSKNKPDICSFTHFDGSGVYPADGGTSAACPVATGVVAAIRSVHSPADITAVQLRNIIRKNAKDLGNRGFDYNYGYGLINPMGIVNAIS